MRHGHVLFCATLMMLLPATGFAQQDTTDPRTIPAIKAFIGTGFGAKNASAPAELEQFGRLAGVWEVEVEMRGPDGSWTKSAPGLWVWKYALDGYAVRDLWYQSADRLPMYMANLGRDYLLTANRIYDVASKKWQVAWMANGAGQVMGADFGTFTAVLEGDTIVMTSPPDEGAFGLQRVSFSEISEGSFKWKSEYSPDNGKSWNPVMRMHARRKMQP